MIRKEYEAGALAAFAIAVNCLFRYLCQCWGLPLRLDSLGTMLAAYFMGPVSGTIVGAASGMVRGFRDSGGLWEMIPQTLLGITVGIYARKGCFRSFFDTVTACTAAAGLTAVVYTLGNWLFYGGLSGNGWADGVYAMLREYGVPKEAASLLGEFFLEFPDKFVSMTFLYGALRLGRHLVGLVNRGFKRTLVRWGLLVLATLAAMAVFIAVPAAAQEETPDYSRYIRTVYGSGEGLLSGEANDIASTDDGIIWIGTYAGLYRYSGEDFQYMANFEQVKNVNCLFVDVEGRLWIGTNDDGLSICIEDEIVNTFDEDHGFPCNSVRSVTQGSDGNFYVGTSKDLAVLSLTGGSKILRTYPQIAYADCVTADDRGHVAALTADGELFLLNETGILQQVRQSSGSFTCCEFAADGRLYLGTDKGRVYAYEVLEDRLGERTQISGEALSAVNSITQLENGSIVLCTDGEIVWLDTQGRLHDINTGSFNSCIGKMTVDYQGNLWFTSARLGVMKLCPSPFMEVYPETGLEEKVVNAITRWQGKLYFATDDGLDILDESDEKPVENDLSEFLKGSRIRCVTKDSRGRLWLCVYGKGVVCALSPISYRVYAQEDGLLGTKARSLLELSDGTMAVATDQGISFIREDRVTGSVGKAQGLHTPLVLCMLEQADGTLLAGTDGGGIALIRDGRVVRTVGRGEGLSSGVVLRLVADRETGKIFVVTSNGLCLYVPDGNARWLKSFPYSNNYDLLDRGDGRVYITGSAGIYVVDKQELMGDRVENYENLNYLSGLRGSFTANAWNYLDDQGNWYIAGGSGVTKFDFGSYTAQKRRSYRMLMNKVTIDASQHILNDDTVITVPSGAVSLTLSPEIINYSAQEPYVSYYLEGAQDEEKTVVLQRSLGDIVYTNLDTGEYKFHLSILDGPKGKVIEELVYTIRKEAENYEQLWFRALFFGELILIVAWFTWFFTRKWSDRAMELQRREISLARDQIRMGNETILAIAKTVDAKDENTSQHSVRVAEYSCMIAKRMGYSEEELENLRRAALLHDIGKIGIPDNVLNKPGRLTDEEYVVMKSHVSKGGEILKDFTLIPHVQEGALYHHERYDGRGYVAGLAGKDIPEIARIIGIADAFDAMTANRVYRKHLPFDVVLSELHKGRGAQFDPEILDIFLGIIDEGIISEKTLYGEEK